jgi:PPOX class probable F420-dependent enzyme
MIDPRASRPYMPGYGILDASQGTGLLPWSWALERLIPSRNYWLVTVRPDGRPHAMPVWAVWRADALWFSSSLGSRKVRNLRANPECVATTEDAMDPVVLEGTAEVVTDLGAIEEFLAASNEKYHTDYGIDFLDPAVNATVRMAPRSAFASRHDDFAGSPTRWTFTAG